MKILMMQTCGCMGLVMVCDDGDEYTLMDTCNECGEPITVQRLATNVKATNFIGAVEADDGEKIGVEVPGVFAGGISFDLLDKKMAEAA